ncbi:hypothetical protein VNO78_13947 [Psophocarpus tetragonolobus]|uniref:BHLH domain-containing protein n=1 Tax=Psophocarpus tetragonolobus TaxID=3891 RepID=A0AAN9SPN0_PSOTE
MYSGDGWSLEPMYSGVSLQSLLLGAEVEVEVEVEAEAKRQRVESPVIPQSKLARQRRQKLSEKTRCLQRLMPWDKKMDQATLLQEAYKYVKFLQAQSRLLHSMPAHTHTHTHTHTYTSLPPLPLQNAAVLGDLPKLTRTQLLQVLLNSPVAQTMLYSQGFCVFSLEHLSLLTNHSSNFIPSPFSF